MAVVRPLPDDLDKLTPHQNTNEEVVSGLIAADTDQKATVTWSSAALQLPRGSP